MVIKIWLLLIQIIFRSCIILACFIDQLISLSWVFNGLLPLQVELMSLTMKSFEFFSGFIKLNLSGLGLCNFSFKFISFSSNFYGQFFNLKCQLFYLGFICSSVLFKSQVIFFLLSSSKGPLLKLLLIPIHFKFKLIHFLVSLEDHVLDVVQPILLVSYTIV